jgi:hypothetical protein
MRASGTVVGIDHEIPSGGWPARHTIAVGRDTPGYVALAEAFGAFP